MFEILADYLKLVNKVEAFLARVKEKFGSEIHCQIGCTDCCQQEFGIFPIEAYYLWQGWPKSIEKESGKCPLLKENLCLAYPFRPLICRTQGYPLWSREGEKEGYPLITVCPKNFSKYDLNTLPSEYVLNLDLMNKILVSINYLFVKKYHLDLPLRLKISEIPNFKEIFSRL
ncbi:MAG TPA: YkgJ family cysteine cluster protein [Candidatus Desulfofervidus auxilii]|uniref:YkgJ family cysteine cluster protein n=1 Tax=Desulfofervidus auxilii TaxID=1621989 RepID=A0A7C0Y329_DESA2|nr:YkgJ family cysteine cluster protein [Candidatus Desulfofervidus auxilii]